MSIATVVKPQSQPIKYEVPRFERIEITDMRIIAHFSDERTVSVPLGWSWRLEQATRVQRANYKIIGSGRTAYWPEVDEHISVQSFFTGTPAPRPKSQTE